MTGWYVCLSVSGRTLLSVENPNIFKKKEKTNPDIY